MERPPAGRRRARAAGIPLADHGEGPISPRCAGARRSGGRPRRGGRPAHERARAHGADPGALRRPGRGGESFTLPGLSRRTHADRADDCVGVVRWRRTTFRPASSSGPRRCSAPRPSKSSSRTDEKRVLWRKVARLAVLSTATALSRRPVGELRRTGVAPSHGSARRGMRDRHRRRGSHDAVGPVDQDHGEVDYDLTTPAQRRARRAQERARRDCRKRRPGSERLGVPSPVLSRLVAEADGL